MSMLYVSQGYLSLSRDFHLLVIFLSILGQLSKFAFRATGFIFFSVNSALPCLLCGFGIWYVTINLLVLCYMYKDLLHLYAISEEEIHMLFMCLFFTKLLCCLIPPCTSKLCLSWSRAEAHLTNHYSIQTKLNPVSKIQNKSREEVFPGTWNGVSHGQIPSKEPPLCVNV